MGIKRREDSRSSLIKRKKMKGNGGKIGVVKTRADRG